MKEIIVQRLDEKQIKEMGISSWPIWTKEVSEFPWTYDEKESCYFLEGEVEVIPQNGTPVKIQKGDFVVFPQGLSCTWKVKKFVKKHYKFG